MEMIEYYYLIHTYGICSVQSPRIAMYKLSDRLSEDRRKVSSLIKDCRIRTGRSLKVSIRGPMAISIASHNNENSSRDRRACLRKAHCQFSMLGTSGESNFYRNQKCQPKERTSIRLAVVSNIIINLGRLELIKRLILTRGLIPIAQSDSLTLACLPPNLPFIFLVPRGGEAVQASSRSVHGFLHVRCGRLLYAGPLVQRSLAYSYRSNDNRGSRPVRRGRARKVHDGTRETVEHDGHTTISRFGLQ
ncbi:unnamed protein product [Nesidiocoris tenuis]|uniref:Uncharacterized protein n=1 Tax=Nesidiocoris tenuis TaxID=355587 RepID=A0A6H5GM51_9HEMI|nr:unnamed protein product [Nesidiocoris tenuis]